MPLYKNEFKVDCTFVADERVVDSKGAPWLHGTLECKMPQLKDWMFRENTRKGCEGYPDVHIDNDDNLIGRMRIHGRYSPV